MNIETATGILIQGQALESDDIKAVFHEIMQGQCSDEAIANFLIALKNKGETAQDLCAAVEALNNYALTIESKQHPLIDIVGTGGDGRKTFNISTTAAFVLSAAGAAVAKHGNRSVSSASGSADILEKAGANLNLTPETSEQCLKEVGITFLFAQNHHPAMKHVANARKNLGTRTIFNLLGPLLNPAHTPYQLIGVSDKKWLQPFASVCQQLQKKHVLIVHSQDGLDEFSIAAPTDVLEYQLGRIREFTIDPKQFNLWHESLDPILVNNSEQSLKIMMSVLNNEPGPALDIVLLNAGAAIFTAGLSFDIKSGIRLAQKAIQKGHAKQKLEEFIQFTNQASK